MGYLRRQSPLIRYCTYTILGSPDCKTQGLGFTCMHYSSENLIPYRPNSFLHCLLLKLTSAPISLHGNKFEWCSKGPTNTIWQKLTGYFWNKDFSMWHTGGVERCRRWSSLWTAPVVPLPANNTTSDSDALTELWIISLERGGREGRRENVLWYSTGVFVQLTGPLLWRMLSVVQDEKSLCVC